MGQCARLGEQCLRGRGRALSGREQYAVTVYAEENLLGDLGENLLLGAEGRGRHQSHCLSQCQTQCQSQCLSLSLGSQDNEKESGEGRSRLLQSEPLLSTDDAGGGPGELWSLLLMQARVIEKCMQPWG
jgi:hypothetical protein